MVTTMDANPKAGEPPIPEGIVADPVLENRVPPPEGQVEGLEHERLEEAERLRILNLQEQQQPQFLMAVVPLPNMERAIKSREEANERFKKLVPKLVYDPNEAKVMPAVIGVLEPEETFSKFVWYHDYIYADRGYRAGLSLIQYYNHPSGFVMLSPGTGWENVREINDFYMFLENEEVSLNETVQNGNVPIPIANLEDRALDALFVENLENLEVPKQQPGMSMYLSEYYIRREGHRNSMFTILDGEMVVVRYGGEPVETIHQIHRAAERTSDPIERFKMSAPGPRHGWESKLEASEFAKYMEYLRKVRDARASGGPVPLHPLEQARRIHFHIPNWAVHQGATFVGYYKAFRDDPPFGGHGMQPYPEGYNLNDPSNAVGLFDLCVVHALIENLEREVEILQDKLGVPRGMNNARDSDSEDGRSEFGPDHGNDGASTCSTLVDNRGGSRAADAPAPSRSYTKKWDNAFQVVVEGAVQKTSKPKPSGELYSRMCPLKKQKTRTEDLGEPNIRYTFMDSDLYLLLKADGNYDPDFRGLDLRLVFELFLAYGRRPYVLFPPADLRPETRVFLRIRGYDNGNDCIGCFGVHYFRHCPIFRSALERRQILMIRGCCLICRGKHDGKCDPKDLRECKCGRLPRHHEDLCLYSTAEKDRALAHGFEFVPPRD